MNEVEEFQQTRYRCTVCSKSYTQKARTVAHVKDGCVKDPATKACKTCVHWQPDGHCAIGAKDYDTWAIRHCESWETDDD